jgi:inhibitor of cysteine peptidase
MLFSTTMSNANQPPEPIITVKKNAQFTIELDSNPSTGYTNIITELDPTFIKNIKKEYKPQQTKPGLIGAGGIDLFTFKALKKGKTTLVIEYVRPWEKPLQPVRTISYPITIQ